MQRGSVGSVVRSLTAIVTVLGAAACGGGKKPATSAPSDAPPADGTASADRLPADAPPGTPPPAEITFVAADGATIAGTYWAPPDPLTEACVVFVHQLSSTRAEYAPVIERLRGKAHLLAFDMRGHGASTDGGEAGKLDWQHFGSSDWAQVETDLGTGVEWLGTKGAGSRCVLVGASIGSSAVVRYVGANPDRARALVLLSPGLAYRGLKTPDAARKNTAPVLIVHSQEPGAVDAAGALAGIWRDATPPVAVEVLADPGTAHGMKIVTGDPKVLDAVVGFIDRALGGEPAR